MLFKDADQTPHKAFAKIKKTNPTFKKKTHWRCWSSFWSSSSSRSC